MYTRTGSQGSEFRGGEALRSQGKVVRESIVGVQWCAKAGATKGSWRKYGGCTVVCQGWNYKNEGKIVGRAKFEQQSKRVN